MEETSPGNPPTTATASALTRQLGMVRCLWEDCCAEFEVGTSYEVWKEHVKSAHVEQQNEGGSRFPRMIRCRWGTCVRSFKQAQGAGRHMAKHLQATQKPRRGTRG